MGMTELVPWGRSGAPSTARGREIHPVLALHHGMNRLFDDFFRDFNGPVAGLWSTGWPQIDLVETDTEYRVSVELPGLDEMDVEIVLSGDVLTLKGEKKIEGDGQGAVYAERFHGRFQRSIQLGADIDRDKVTASFKNGVLTVVLPKSAEAETHSRRIPINGS